MAKSRPNEGVLEEITEGISTPVQNKFEAIETTVTHIIVAIMGMVIVLAGLFFAYLHLTSGQEISTKWVILQFLWIGGGMLFLIPKRVQAIAEVLKDKLPSWGGRKG